MTKVLKMICLMTNPVKLILEPQNANDLLAGVTLTNAIKLFVNKRATANNIELDPDYALSFLRTCTRNRGGYQFRRMMQRGDLYDGAIENLLVIPQDLEKYLIPIIRTPIIADALSKM